MTRVGWGSVKIYSLTHYFQLVFVWFGVWRHLPSLGGMRMACRFFPSIGHSFLMVHRKASSIRSISSAAIRHARTLPYSHTRTHAHFWRQSCIWNRNYCFCQVDYNAVWRTQRKGIREFNPQLKVPNFLIVCLHKNNAPTEKTSTKTIAIRTYDEKN